MSTVFFTGFPGFLGTELLPRILARDPDARAACLVQPKFANLARGRAREIGDRIDVLEGDLTQPGLGLGAAPGLRDEITEIYHLAAIYDLSVGREIAMRINVEGTRRMLEFASGCPRLASFQYVSTCYVSGTHPGVFAESDLDRGQRFHNFYEETKYLAEVEVQKCMREGLRATIYRPAVVVGDSRTGTTQKYDGPYSVIRLLLRQPRLAVMPMIGNPTKAEINVVPRDFVVDSIAYLSARPDTAGCVFQLADPKPLTVDEMVRELGRATGRTVARVPLPLTAAKWSLRHVPGAQRLIGIPTDALDYFVHPAHYATDQTQAALRAGGIRCPHFPEYVDTLVAFVRAHPEVGSAAMA